MFEMIKGLVSSGHKIEYEITSDGEFYTCEAFTHMSDGMFVQAKSRNKTKAIGFCLIEMGQRLIRGT
jgi:hypothetical protein